MKTFILTIVILHILSIGVKLGNLFKPTEFSTGNQIFSSIIQLIIIIFGLILIF